jgi:hypothetical protein
MKVMLIGATSFALATSGTLGRGLEVLHLIRRMIASMAIPGRSRHPMTGFVEHA